MRSSRQQPLSSNLSIPDLLRDLEQGADPLDLAIGLLRAALDRGDFHRSVGNCHTGGVDSVVLFDNTAENGGMVRYYFAHHGQHQLDYLYDEAGHFTVGIHNHCYQIAKIPLNEMVHNVRTAVSDQPTGVQLYEYKFQSALKGDEDQRLRVVGPELKDMKPIEHDLLDPGDVSIMAAEDLHTMQVPKHAESPGSAWLVVEGPQQPIQSVIYSPRADLSLCDEGLYEPMSAEHARRLTQQVLDLTLSKR